MLRIESRPSWRSRLVAGTVALTLATAGMALVATPANAAAQPVSSGSLDWGVKETFRNYVAGPIASGSVTTGAGASTNGNGTYKFGTATGTLDPAASTADVDFAGNVHFVGHAGALDLTFSSPNVVVSGTTGTLYVDYVGKSFTDGSQISGSHVALATLSGATVSSTSVAASTVTLTAEGAPAFGGFYPAGTVLDALAATVASAVPATATSTALATSPASPQLAGTSVTLTATVTPAAAGTVQFFAGATAIGSPATVVSGVATLATTAIPAGSQSLTAAFTPSSPAAFLASTSPASTYVVTTPPAAVTPTVTTVVGTAVQTVATDAATAQPAKFGNAVTFTTTVSGGAAGTVQFLDGTTPIGAPVAVAAGSASVTTSTLAAGAHSVTAAFVPADAAAFTSATTATALTYRVALGTAPAACTVTAAGSVPITGATASWGFSTYASTGVWTHTATGSIATNGALFDFSGGTGSADVDCTIVNYVGSFSLVNAPQGGITVTFTNPTFIIDADGSGQLVADLSTTTSLQTGATLTSRATVATFTGANVTPTAGAVGFTVTPAYAGTVAAGSFSGAFTGAFPGSFVFGIPSSIRAFFYESGTTGSNLNKPPLPLTVAYPYVAPTTTRLVASPAKPAVLGDTVTLTATVAAAVGTAAGSVQFLDGATLLATVPLSGGTASTTVSTFVAGGHSLSAVYVPVAGFTASSSTAAHYGVADPTTAAACVVDADAALPITGGTTSWAVSKYVWDWTGNSVSGNAAIGASAFELTGGTGTYSDECTVLDFDATITLSNGFYATVVITDPTLSVGSDGSGVLVADVSSIVTAPGTPETTTASRVVIATFGDADATPVADEVDFTVTPDYAGTVASGTFAAGYDSAFPVPFVLSVSKQLQAFFYLSGTTASQLNKPAAALSAAWSLPVYTPTVTPSSSTITVGTTATFTGAGFAPGETVSAIVFSDPVDLGTAVAGADGTVSFTWAVAPDFDLGAHTVVLTALRSASTATAGFSVAAAVVPPVTTTPAAVAPAASTSAAAAERLASTGANSFEIVMIALLLATAGGALVVAARRRRGELV